MDSVSVTKSIRVSGELATQIDNLIAAGEFETTSELILAALAQFLERYELDANWSVLRIKVPAEVERRLKVLADAGDGPSREDAAVRVLRDYTKERVKALVGDNEEFDREAAKLQKRGLEALSDSSRERVVSK
jgi:Arc/MetJ-type ribon-helix-helix transcriptional regulator